MVYTYRNLADNGCVIVFENEKSFERWNTNKEKLKNSYILAWNTGEKQKIIIDREVIDFNSNCLLPIMMDQTFKFEKPENIVAWQFNKEFYCIIYNDKDLECSGFLFYGPEPNLFIELNKKDEQILGNLLERFILEFTNEEIVKEDMLRVLTTELIIHTTRFAKLQHPVFYDLDNSQADLIRRFNLLVELHYKKQKQLQFYANQLKKSTKTISNIFAKHSQKAPIKIISERVIIESKRLLFSTTKNISEIADILGFDSISHFSSFFKKHIKMSPLNYRKSMHKNNTESL